MLNLVSSNGNNRTNHVGVQMMDSEKEESFLKSMYELKEYCDAEGLTIGLFITDNSDACVNSIQKVFGNPPIVLCRWHMNKDVLAFIRVNCGERFRQIREKGIYHDSPDTELLLSRYHDVLTKREDG